MRSLILIIIPYIILYKIHIKSLSKKDKPLKLMRSLILTIITCIILHKTRIKNI